jgi:hypothetical protein
MVHLAEIWPEAVPFTTLVNAARARLTRNAKSVEADREHLGQCLLTFYTSAASLVEFHVCPPPFTLKIGERPTASPLARLQAGEGNRVTNLRHEVIVLGNFERQLLRHLDGNHDRNALIALLVELVQRDVLKVEDHGQRVSEPEKLRQILAQAIEAQLPKLARSALLSA